MPNFLAHIGLVAVETIATAIGKLVWLTVEWHHPASPAAMSEFKTDPAVLSLLQQAVEGLVWLSESEYPFDLLEWHVAAGAPFTVETLRQSTHPPLDCPVQTLTLAALFQPVLQEQDWFGAAEQQTRQRFQALYHLLQTHLPDCQVYRLGDIEVDVYIVGRLNPTQYIGLHTHLVETGTGVATVDPHPLR